MGRLCGLLLVHCIVGALTVPAGASSVGLAQADAHFRAGETIERTVVVVDATKSRETIEAQWETSVGRAIVQQGRERIDLDLDGKGSANITLAMPDVKRAVDLRLLIQAGQGSEALSCEALVRVYPLPGDLSWEFARGKRVATLGYTGEMAAALKDGGARVRRLMSASGMTGDDHDLLIVAAGELDEERAWVKFHNLLSDPELRSPTLVLRQGRVSQTPSDDGARDLTVVAIRALGHPVFSGLDDTDMRMWSGDGVVGGPSYPLPRSGGFRILLADSGVPGRALIYEKTSAGGAPVLFCQSALTEKWEDEPVCRPLARALVQRLLTEPLPIASEGVAVVGEPDGDWVEAMAASVLGVTYLGTVKPLTEAGAVIVNASEESVEAIRDTQSDFFDQLVAFVELGGVALVCGVEPDTLEYFDPVLGRDPELSDISEDFSIPDPTDPRLWGTSHDDWARVIGDESMISLTIRDDRRVESKTVIAPGLLTLVEKGKGKFVFLQPTLADCKPEDIRLVLNQLLTNLGVHIQNEAEPPSTRGFRF